jgi:hypothetical protein
MFVIEKMEFLYFILFFSHTVNNLQENIIILFIIFVKFLRFLGSFSVGFLLNVKQLVRYDAISTKTEKS